MVGDTYTISFDTGSADHIEEVYYSNKISEEGYTNIYDFKGGLADWQDAEYSFAE